MNDKVKEFWDAQAVEHGASDLATAPDHFYRELEIANIIEHLEPGKKILDVGCGNGYSTKKFYEAVNQSWANNPAMGVKYPATDIVGIDYSEKMIEEAKKLESSTNGLFFTTGDVRTLGEDTSLDQFDTIISERCLINLANWEEQKTALLEMKKCLKPGGKIILVENFEDGLDNLNDLRVKFDLPSIDIRWHNCYLRLEEFNKFASEHFYCTSRENIGNLYYIISRVVYAALCKASDKKPEYDHLINKIASQLPILGIGWKVYSPNFLFVLETK